MATAVSGFGFRGLGGFRLGVDIGVPLECSMPRTDWGALAVTSLRLRVCKRVLYALTTPIIRAQHIPLSVGRLPSLPSCT